MKPVTVFLGAFLMSIIGTAGSFSVLSKKAALKTTEDSNRVLKIAFVNLTKIKNEGLAFKSLNALLAEESKKFQQEIQDMEANIRKEYEDIKRLKKEAKTSETKLRQMKDALDHKTRDIERSILAKKEELDQKFAKLSVLIEEKLKDIIQRIYTKKGLDVVLNATILDFPVVLNCQEHFDVSDDVLTQINKELPKLAL
jgi:Skp family chaperone for outer membrane proteins